jgi:hypothetical protein
MARVVTLAKVSTAPDLLMLLNSKKSTEFSGIGARGAWALP